MQVKLKNISSLRRNNMLSTSSYSDFKSGKYMVYSISGDRGVDADMAEDDYLFRMKQKQLIKK